TRRNENLNEIAEKKNNFSSNSIFGWNENREMDGWEEWDWMLMASWKCNGLVSGSDWARRRGHGWMWGRDEQDE
ncbi:hypothetical protein L249_0135, partial [Ophiocordyceps polyrhachis-furcata BCC 54312]